jgi:hypothetical protein
MGGERRVVCNEEVAEILAEIPEGHRHLRTTLRLADGTEWVLQEATVANLVRAYVTVKTHPARASVRLVGRRVAERKAGYAEWQLLEEEGGNGCGA